MIELAGHKFEAKEILWRIVHNLPTSKRKDQRRMRWARVSDALAMGSTVSMAICREFNLDPDEYI